MNFLHIHRHAIHVAHVRGLNPKAPVYAMIHGIAAAGVSWLPLARHLAPHASRFVLPDLPAHGLSPAPTPPFDVIEAYRLLKNALIQTLDPDDDNVIIGNSLGGAFALKFCLECPDLVRQCVLISPAGAPFAAAARDVIAPFCPQSIVQTRDLIGRVFTRPTPATHMFLAPYLRLTTRTRGFRSLMESILELDTNDDAPLRQLLFSPQDLQNLTTHTCLVWGGSDHVLPSDMRNYFDLHLPASAHRVFPPHFGHCPQFEHSRELADIIQNFIHSAPCSIFDS